MALSLESIYQPFAAFFTQKFAADGAPVKFRFDHLPKALIDADFLMPGHPESGPSPAIIKELLSSIIDGVPHLDADGRNVSLGASRISELYHDEILVPALPLVPEEVTDSAAKQALVDQFNATKADALRLWQQNQEMSLLEGAGVAFHPSTAMPATWWNKNDATTWNHQTFRVKGAAEFPRSSAAPSGQLLRMKVDDSTLSSLVQSNVLAPVPPPGPAAAPAALPDPQTLRTLQPVFSAALANSAEPATDADASPAVARPAIAASPPATNFSIQDHVTLNSASLPFAARLGVQRILAADAPTQPMLIFDATISFDYCLVNLTRPWWHDAFIHNRNWRIPRQAKGQLSANDGHGLPAIPVGFVAIKSLSIQAPWTRDDITNLQQSVQFGPFNFDPTLVKGAITHEGIQIIGWLLQDLPDLPPAS